MKPQAISILDFIKSTDKTFVIPVYQRNYSWDTKNCEKLFSDLQESLRTNKHHYFGNIVYYALSDNRAFGYTELALIDGQQRITSTMILLAAIRDSEKNEDVRNAITETYLENSKGDEKNRVKLKQIEGDRNIYEAIIRGDFDGSSSSNAGRNYKKFKQLIKESKLTTDELLEAINNLEVIALDLNINQESESPQIIFESINATGKELTTADLLRNYLLLGIKDKDEQERYYKDYWLPIENNIGSSDSISDFINKYLIMRIGDTVNKGTEYEEFKKRYEKLFGSDAKLALEQLKHYSKYFLWISEPSRIYDQHRKVSNALKDLKEFSIVPITPLLLFICERADSSECDFDMDSLERALRYIEAWAFRARVVGLLTSGQFNSIASRSILNAAKRAKTSNYDEIIRYELSNYSTQDIWPTDADFRQAFMKYNFYKNYKNYVQRKLEYKISNDRINEKPDSIEHILPETLNDHWKGVLGPDYSAIHAEWLHTIGNLTPMNQPDNSFNSNDSYDKKRPQYLKSSWELTRNVGQEYDSWDATKIENRAQALAAKATEIWQGPALRERPITAEVKRSKSGREEIDDDIRSRTYSLDSVRKGERVSAKMTIEVQDGKNVFVVLAGSRIFPYQKHDLKLKEKVEKDLINQGFEYEVVLKHDYRFTTSVSASSDFVTGGSTNGWDEWTDEEGISLNDLTTDKPTSIEKQEDEEKSIRDQKPELSEEEKAWMERLREKGAI